tara:strand:+ start:2096 stop:2398 length:303 start_codon:yes stop_codon:yes gene_type:complete
MDSLVSSDESSDLFGEIEAKYDPREALIAKLYLNRKGYSGLISRTCSLISMGDGTKIDDIERELRGDYLNLIYQIGEQIGVSSKECDEIFDFIYGLETKI